MSKILDLENKLIEFGLNDKAARVYLYLLGKDRPVAGNKIALSLKLHRQYIYNSLIKLSELNLVSLQMVGKQKRYSAAPPAEISKIARTRAQFADELVRDLHEVSLVGHEQNFEVIKGLRDLRSHEMNYINSVMPGETEYIIGGITKVFEAAMGEYIDEYTDILNKKKIVMKYIGSVSEIEHFKNFNSKYPKENLRFLKELPTGVCDILIRGDKVLFYSFLNPPLIYVINSPKMADYYIKFFNMLWNLAEPLPSV